MRSLVIVGNGFDIAHDLQTKYSDFTEYLRSSSDKEEQKLFLNIQKYIDIEDLWNSLESALGNLDYDQLQDDNSVYLVSYSADNWRDSMHHDYQYMINEDLNFASVLPRYFRRWINTICTCVNPKFRKRVVKADNLYLNFNYTDTLESVYGIPENSICYIHGKALRDDPLILGHHDRSFFDKGPDPVFNDEEEKERYYDNFYSEDVRILEAQESISQYFKITYKDTERIIKNNAQFFSRLAGINRVYVIGHSCSEIDYDYFVEVNAYVGSNCDWLFSCFSDADIFATKRIAENLGISDRCRFYPVQCFYKRVFR